MKMISRLLLVFIFVGMSYGINNGLGRTPPMGKRNNVCIFQLFTLFQVGIVGIIFGVVTMRQGSGKQSM
jgi:TRAP-type C4-dicarboxylate transport system permease small subunit